LQSIEKLMKRKTKISIERALSFVLKWRRLILNLYGVIII
jgi:hypothetical protein